MEEADAALKESADAAQRIDMILDALESDSDSISGEKLNILLKELDELDTFQREDLLTLTKLKVRFL